MKFKKTLALCAALLTLCCCAVTGTLAFPNFFSIAQPKAEEQQVVKIQLDVKENENAYVFPSVPYEKEVSINSKSNVDVYVWYTYSVPAALLDANGNVPLTVQFLNAADWQNNYADKRDPASEYVEFTCLYKQILKPGDTTPVSMKSITLDAHVDRDENGQYLWVDDRTVTPIDYNLDTIEIQCKAYAIAASGFESAEDAHRACTTGTAEAATE